MPMEFSFLGYAFLRLAKQMYRFTDLQNSYIEKREEEHR